MVGQTKCEVREPIEADIQLARNLSKSQNGLKMEASLTGVMRPNLIESGLNFML